MPPIAFAPGLGVSPATTGSGALAADIDSAFKADGMPDGAGQSSFGTVLDGQIDHLNKRPHHSDIKDNALHPSETSAVTSAGVVPATEAEVGQDPAVPVGADPGLPGNGIAFGPGVTTHSPAAGGPGGAGGKELPPGPPVALPVPPPADAAGLAPRAPTDGGWALALGHGRENSGPAPAASGNPGPIPLDPVPRAVGTGAEITVAGGLPSGASVNPRPDAAAFGGAGDATRSEGAYVPARGAIGADPAIASRSDARPAVPAVGAAAGAARTDRVPGDPMAVAQTAPGPRAEASGIPLSGTGSAPAGSATRAALVDGTRSGQQAVVPTAREAAIVSDPGRTAAGASSTPPMTGPVQSVGHGVIDAAQGAAGPGGSVAAAADRAAVRARAAQVPGTDRAAVRAGVDSGARGLSADANPGGSAAAGRGDPTVTAAQFAAGGQAYRPPAPQVMQPGVRPAYSAQRTAVAGAAASGAARAGATPVRTAAQVAESPVPAAIVQANAVLQTPAAPAAATETAGEARGVVPDESGGARHPPTARGVGPERSVRGGELPLDASNGSAPHTPAERPRAAGAGAFGAGSPDTGSAVRAAVLAAAAGAVSSGETVPRANGANAPAASAPRSAQANPPLPAAGAAAGASQATEVLGYGSPVETPAGEDPSAGTQGAVRELAAADWRGSAPTAAATAAPQAMQPLRAEAPLPAAAAAASLPFALGTGAGLGEELGQRILWLSGNRLRGAEIQLDPPELGPLQVQIHTHRDGASVQFLTHTAAARDAVEASLPRLREMLENNGLNLVDVNVAQQQEQRGRGPWEGQTPAPGGSAGARLREVEQAMVSAGSRGHEPRGLVDDYA